MSKAEITFTQTIVEVKEVRWNPEAGETLQSAIQNVEENLPYHVEADGQWDVDGVRYL